jgi:SET domain
MGHWTRALGGWARDAWVACRGRIRSKRAVRAGPSPIDGRGLFAVRSFAADGEIGQLRLGRPGAQGKHTLQVGSRHRTVEPPWRFINHACRPNARLRVTERGAHLVAAREIAAGQELTIDYASLPETPSVAFSCRCGECG